MLRAARIYTALCLFGVAGGCAMATQSKLTAVQANSCRASGGFESSAPFGMPICQYRYSDGGKSCSGKLDCSGRCLSDAPANAQEIAVGTPTPGHCEAMKQTFGCFARVEGGKLAEPYYCED